MTEFEKLLYAADRNVNAIRELKETRESLAFMTGVAVGSIGTALSIAMAYGIWRVIQWLS